MADTNCTEGKLKLYDASYQYNLDNFNSEWNQDLDTRAVICCGDKEEINSVQLVIGFIDIFLGIAIIIKVIYEYEMRRKSRKYNSDEIELKNHQQQTVDANKTDQTDQTIHSQ